MSQLIVSSDTLSSRGNNVLDTNGFKQGDTLLLDFFAGAGGATQGFVLAGFKPALIVEASKTKRDQYQRNFGKVRKIEVFQRNGNYFVYGDTAEGDASIIIATLKRMLGTYLYRRVKYHVHASPSCVEFCATGRSKKAKKANEKSLSNSLGTFTWTCEVIKKLKEEFKDKMTWSIEDAEEVGSNKINKNGIDFKKLREKLPDCLWNVWDFTLWGVPQDRKRFIALDRNLRIDKIPVDNDFSKIDNEYLSKLVNQLSLDETKNDTRVYSRKSMKGRIGMDKAFELAKVKMTEGVTAQFGQASMAQIATRIRETNKIRKDLMSKVESERKKLKNNRGYIPDCKKAEEAYANHYYDLTKLAYNDLVKFIKSCDEAKLSTFYRDDEIITYIRKAREWLKDVEEDEVDDYLDACIGAYSENYIDYAFATTEDDKLAHSRISLAKVLQVWRVEGRVKTNLKDKIKVIVDKNQKAKTSDLRDYFGLKVARYYSANVTANGKFMDERSSIVKTRPLWAPSFTIQAKGWKNWFRPLKPGSIWYTTGMKFAFMTKEQMMALGTFPRDYNFGSDKLADIRMAIGDSVPPLITLRLGLQILGETIDPETALVALYNFTPPSDLIADLLVEFKKWCLQSIKSEDTYNNFYLPIITKHLEQNEFLSTDMMIKWEWIPRENDPDNGFRQATAVKWIEMLDYLEDTGFFTEEKLKAHIRRKGLWRNSRKWIREHMWLHPDRNIKGSKEEYKKKRDKFMKNIMDKAKPRDRTIGTFRSSFGTMQRILQEVTPLLTEVAKEESSKEENNNRESRRSAETTLTLQDVLVQFKYKLKF